MRLLWTLRVLIEKLKKRCMNIYANQFKNNLYLCAVV